MIFKFGALCTVSRPQLGWEKPRLTEQQNKKTNKHEGRNKNDLCLFWLPTRAYKALINTIKNGHSAEIFNCRLPVGGKMLINVKTASTQLTKWATSLKLTLTVHRRQCHRRRRRMKTLAFWCGLSFSLSLLPLIIWHNLWVFNLSFLGVALPACQSVRLPACHPRMQCSSAPECHPQFASPFEMSKPKPVLDVKCQCRLSEPRKCMWGTHVVAPTAY